MCALIGSEHGMNATTAFVTGLPAPDNLRVADKTDRSVSLEWDIVVLADYYKVSYLDKGYKDEKIISY